MNLNSWLKLLLYQQKVIYYTEKSYQEKRRILTENSNPVFARTVLHNELLIDSDNKQKESFESRKKVAKEIISVLEKLKIPYIFSHSGSIGSWHFQIFYDKNVIIPIEIIEDLKNYTTEEIEKQIKEALFKYILSFLSQETKKTIDEQCGISSTRLVRVFGSPSLSSGLPKSYIRNLNETNEPPKEVTFPERIETWKIPEKLLFLVCNLYLKKRIKKVRINFGSTNYEKFVEKLYNEPLPDGRHRCSWGIFVPFVVLKGMTTEDGTEWIWNWIEKSNQLRRTDVSKKIVSYWIDRARRLSIKPFKFKTLLEKLSDVPELLKLFGEYNEEKRRTN